SPGLEPDEYPHVLSEILNDKTLMAQALEELRTGHRERRWIDRSGTLADMIKDDIPDQATCYRRRNEQAVDVHRNGSQIEVSAGVERIIVPIGMAAAIELALNGQPFTVKDLPCSNVDEQMAVC